MEQNRQIRFLIPPFFLMASLLWGAYLSDKILELLELLKKVEPSQNFLNFLAAAGVVIAVGFLIGLISVSVLRVTYKIWLWDWEAKYDAPYENEVVERVRNQIGMPENGDFHVIYPIATFQNAVIEDGIQKWLGRRWNAFNVSAHSFFALWLAHGLGFIFEIRQTCYWWVTTVVISIMLVLNACNAYKETRDMTVFQSFRKFCSRKHQHEHN